MFKKLFLAAGFSLATIASASATCGAIPLPVLDATGTSRNISSATAGDGNCKTYIDADTASQIHNDLTAAVPLGANYIGQFGPWVAPLSYVSGTTAAMTSTTSTQLLAAVATKKLYVTSISCVNSHATVGTFVTVQDGSGGTALATLAAAAVFGGDEKTSVGPLFSTTAGNALFVADVTTGANVICNASGFAQ